MAENNFYPVQDNKIEGIDTERGSAFVDLAGLEYFWNNAKEYIDTGDINANNVYTTKFVFGELVRGRATASRELLDAVKNGKIIRVPRNNPDTPDNMGYIIANATISSYTEGDTLNIEIIDQYSFSCPYTIVARAKFNTDTTSATLTIARDNKLPTKPDWSINRETDPNYIANRTHYHNQYGILYPGQRYSIADQETIHDLNNYRLFFRGDLFKIQEGKFTITKDNTSITFNCVGSESGKTITWTLSPVSFSGFEENEYITVASKLGNYKPLDEFYLPDTIGRVYSAEFTFNDMHKAQVVRVTRELAEAILEKKIIVIPNTTLDIGGYIANCYCRKAADNSISGYLEVTNNTAICRVNIKLLNYEKFTTTNVTVTQLQPALRSGNNIKTINGASILGSGNIELITDIESIPVSEIESFTYIEE